MAQVKEDNIDISEKIGNAERYVTDNKKSLTIIASAVVGVIAVYLGYQQFIVKPQEENARKEMYVAEQYFSKDSLNLAINGDGSFPGFKEITENYGSSQSGNLAQYYLGMSYLKKGEYDKAIETLKAYDAEDDVTGALALGGIAGAQLELGHLDEALDYYKKAADWDENNFTKPIFMMKSAMVYEMKKDYKSSLDIYKQVKAEFPNSSDARDIDKYIGRAEALSGSEK
ncbi:MAG: tetratricopeptide repeat protein [Bacteroidota bacterium]